MSRPSIRTVVGAGLACAVVLGLFVLVIQTLAEDSDAIPPLQARESPGSRSPHDPIPRPFEISLALSQQYHDVVSLKTTRASIYTVHVSPSPLQEWMARSCFDIRYSLDGRLISTFRFERLPFSFSRNLLGQEPGRHVIKVEVADRDRRAPLASAEVDLTLNES